MRTHILVAGLLITFASSAPALSLGGGLGHLSLGVSEPSSDSYHESWKASSAIWSVKLVDPSGSILSGLSTASGNYGRMLGAQQKAQAEADRTGGTATASYEARTSVSSTGSTQYLEFLWSQGGTFENPADYHPNASHTLRDDSPDYLAMQATLGADLGSWNGVVVPAVSLVSYGKMILGYTDIKAVSGDPALHGAGTTVSGKMWMAFPFGLSIVYDAPLHLSAKVFAGYDPLTGLVSIWSKNVHQAWEYGAGAEWAPLGWLVAEANWVHGVTNLQDTRTWKTETNTLGFGARIDFDGF